ncbi:MAG TPA: ABC transporter, partial [Ruminococcaceae bacterium]|nr:ABC transporter [Oscillospiraceae bacterium]
KNLAFSSLRGAVAMVSQETYIFMGTIAENIAYARPDAGHAEIVRAAQAASAHNFICRLPDGYDTIIGSGGRELSGGERQRISIARAILADPRILVLDEATASVDTETERGIQESLEKLIKGRTTISIAHRLSTLRNADHLIVLDKGELVESGTHAELVAKQGEYYKLLQLQSKALAMRGIGD